MSLREQLRAVAPELPLHGKLLRPTIAFAARRGESVALLRAVAAVQLAHEASLLHDDVVDDAAQRRGLPALHVQRGVGAAIVAGDALLARGYALAIATGSAAFASTYAHAIEMTIAGELEQARRLGDVLTMDEYEEIIARKSGDLIACAFAAQSFLDSDARADAQYSIGRRLGTFYQMVDDLLDYLPSRAAGKPPFGDFLQRRWTWPMVYLGLTFGDDVRDRFDHSRVASCVTALRDRAEGLSRAFREYPEILGLIDSWMMQVHDAAIESWIERRLRGAADRASYFSRNSRSFSFAARLLPASHRESIQAIYAYCRFTDDLVDDADGAPVSPGELLDWWERESRRAQAGTPSGYPLIDDAMRVTPAFSFPAELIRGMRMDAAQVRFADMNALRDYTHCVAGVIGQWLVAVFGDESDWLRTRADELGHAMQLTNILRDVGEDWRGGRLYLPRDHMNEHGVTELDVELVATTGRATAKYQALITALMAEADTSYALAYEAIPQLPSGVQRAITVAARIYQGIHDSLRANQYNNGTVRARTSLAGKLLRALPALL